MTEADVNEADVKDGQPDPDADTGADTAAAVPAPAEGGRRPGRGRRIAVIAGAALLALGVIGVSGYTVVTVRDADRDPGAPVWGHSLGGDRGREKAAEQDGLPAMLLPYNVDGLAKGPDIGEFGADSELSGKEAAELAKESFSELPRTQRKQLERAVDKRRIKGVAMRSYTVQGTHAMYAFEAVLTQVDGERNAQGDAKGEREVFEVLEDLDVVTAGPKVPGHSKNAWCYLFEAEKKGQNESVHCVGHQGEVMVSLVADAPRPIDKKDVAGLLGKQLDRIETPGEAV